MFKNDNFTRDCLRMIVSDIKKSNRKRKSTKGNHG